MFFDSTTLIGQLGLGDRIRVVRLSAFNGVDRYAPKMDMCRHQKEVTSLADDGHISIMSHW